MKIIITSVYLVIILKKPTIRRYLNTFDWNLVFNNQNIKEDIDTFYKIIYKNVSHRPDKPMTTTQGDWKMTFTRTLSNFGSMCIRLKLTTTCPQTCTITIQPAQIMQKVLLYSLIF